MNAACEQYDPHASSVVLDAYGGEGQDVLSSICASAGSLPNTGYEVLIVVLAAIALLAVGLALRSATSKDDA